MRPMLAALVASLAACSSTVAAPDAGPTSAPPPPAPASPEDESGDPRAGEAAAAPEREDPPPPPPPPGQIDPRDQYALGREIEAARHVDPEQIDRRYGAIRRSWFNRRYRWEMAAGISLCRAGYCPMMPFYHARPGFDVGHGYLPILRTSAEAHARLLELCRPHASCVVRFEGVLSRFDLSSVDPTHLELSEVRFVSARGARPNERWVRPVNVPSQLVQMARENPDAGAIRVGPMTHEHERLQALLQRVHRSLADGGSGDPVQDGGTTSSEPGRAQSSTPPRAP